MMTQIMPGFYLFAPDAEPEAEPEPTAPAIMFDERIDAPMAEMDAAELPY